MQESLLVTMDDETQMVLIRFSPTLIKTLYDEMQSEQDTASTYIAFDREQAKEFVATLQGCIDDLVDKNNLQ